jgi:DNA adenine methylase
MSGLRYPGGKTRSVKLLEKFVPDGHREFVSPFVGGGSFEVCLAKRGVVKCYDIFNPLVVYWNWLLREPEVLADKVQTYIPVNANKFKELRTWLINNQNYVDIEVAATYFVLNRCSFSGTTLSGGYSNAAAEGRFNQASIDRIRNSNLQNIAIGCQSFEETLREPTNAFIFADPPYYTAVGLYGINGEGQNINHEKLRDLIIQSPNWMITYDDCPEIRELYKDYAIISVAWAYGMNESKKSNEIVILSHAVLNDLWAQGKMEFGTLKFE